MIYPARMAVCASSAIAFVVVIGDLWRRLKETRVVFDTHVKPFESVSDMLVSTKYVLTNLQDWGTKLKIDPSAMKLRMLRNLGQTVTEQDFESVVKSALSYVEGVHDLDELAAKIYLNVDQLPTEIFVAALNQIRSLPASLSELEKYGVSWLELELVLSKEGTILTSLNLPKLFCSAVVSSLSKEIAAALLLNWNADFYELPKNIIEHLKASGVSDDDIHQVECTIVREKREQATKSNPQNAYKATFEFWEMFVAKQIGTAIRPTHFARNAHFTDVKAFVDFLSNSKLQHQELRGVPCLDKVLSLCAALTQNATAMHDKLAAYLCSPNDAVKEAVKGTIVCRALRGVSSYQALRAASTATLHAKPYRRRS